MATNGDDGSQDDSDASQVSSVSFEAGETVDVLQDAQYDPAHLNRSEPIASSEDEGEDQDSEEYDRENRFQGTASTWRLFTEEERALIQSLNQQQANDLSVHLYNAHALKARVRNSDAATRVKHHRSKKQWIKPNEDASLPWTPKDSWTAWPLLPNRVPRTGERFGVPIADDGLDGETFKKAESWKPSGDLEEEVLAIAMRKAKEAIRGGTDLNLPGLPENAAFVDVSSDSGSESDILMTDQGSDEGGDAKHIDHPKGDVYEDVINDSILLDDDSARTLLQPGIRHVLCKLDDLLLGLHKSRQGQTRYDSRSRSTTPQSRSASKAATRTSRSQPTRRGRSVSELDDTHEENEVESRKSSRQFDDKPRRQRLLNPRDWSEVLSMAAFTGWDPKVIDRARRRCTSLFGEYIDFSAAPVDPRTTIRSSSAEAVANAQDGTTVDPRDSQSGILPLDWCFCPVQECHRHHDPFDRVWRWREHLKRTHKYSNDQIAELETKLRPDIGQKVRRGRDKHPRKRRAP